MDLVALLTLQEWQQYCNFSFIVSAAMSVFIKSGDHCISINSGYGSSLDILRTYYSRFQVETTFVDMSNIEQVEASLKPNTRVNTYNIMFRLCILRYQPILLIKYVIYQNCVKEFIYTTQT